MATTLIYNDVILQNVLTLSYKQERVEDESHTDRIGYRHTISVETIANVTAAANGFGICGVIVPGTTVSDLIAGVRDLLMVKRSYLSYGMDGHAMLSANYANDLENGPNPVSFTLTHLTPQTVRIQYVVSCVIDDCHGGSPPPIVNNRWSCADVIDERWRTTRTWKGKLRLSNTNGGIISPHSFRLLVLPTLQPGWVRKSMRMLAAPNNLELAYEITDEQMLGDAAPYPCTSWDFTHTEHMSFVGNKCSGTLDIRLNGAPRANKYDMIAFGILLVKLKLIGEDQEPAGTSVIQNVSVTELGGNAENSILIRANVVRSPRATNGLTNGQAIGILSLKNVGKPIDQFDIENYSRDFALNYGPYGTNDPALLAGLFACYLQTPCDISGPDDTPHSMPRGGPQPSEPDDGEESSSTSPSFQFDGESTTIARPAATEISAAVGFIGDYAIEFPTMSDEQTTATYFHAKTDSTIVQDGGYIGLPIARASSDTTDTSTAFIQLYKPQTTRSLRFEFARIQEWPTVIKAVGFTDGNGIVYKIKSWVPTFHSPTKTSDDHTLFVVEVDIEYLMSRPPADDETIPTCELPWDTLSPSDTRFPASALLAPDDADKGIA